MYVSACFFVNIHCISSKEAIFITLKGNMDRIPSECPSSQSVAGKTRLSDAGNMLSICSKPKSNASLGRTLCDFGLLGCVASKYEMFPHDRKQSPCLTDCVAHISSAFRNQAVLCFPEKTYEAVILVSGQFHYVTFPHC